MIKHIQNETEFYDLLKEGKPIVDFYADWCGPCKMLLPILDEIDFTDVLKVNVDELPEIAKRFGVMSIPTLIFFNNGLEQNREIGYRSLEEIKEEFKNFKSLSCDFFNIVKKLKNHRFFVAFLLYLCYIKKVIFFLWKARQTFVNIETHKCDKKLRPRSKVVPWNLFLPLQYLGFFVIRRN